MERLGRVALGSVAGGAAAAVICPRLLPLFSPVEGGVGVLTFMKYPKGYDYAVVALLAIGSFAGGALVAWFAGRSGEAVPAAELAPRRRGVWATAVVVFVLMAFAHDHPHTFMDPFHEGEHLTPAYLFRSGERPYRDVFVLHGLATDGGLDALVLGDPPSPIRTRRLQTILDAAALALLVPVAAELTVTGPGLLLAVFTTLCGAAAFTLPTFPWFRLLPVILATLGLLRYVRTGKARPLLLAFSAASLGVLWSLDTGTYAVGGTAAAMLGIRILKLERRPLPLVRMLSMAAIALVLPFAVLLLLRADIGKFLHDSFVILPGSIDAVWSLPAPGPFGRDSVRYYFPPLFYGFVLALAVLTWRRGETLTSARLLVLGTLSLFLFRTAAGRADPNHTRYAVPMLGLAVVAVLVEPVLRGRKRWIGLTLVIPLVAYFEVGKNLSEGWKLVRGWRERQQVAAWVVPYPFRSGAALHTGEENATHLRTLAAAIDRLGEGTILDFTNERALYYLLERKPPTRCFDIPMLSAPALRAEAMEQLRKNPPLCVIMGGEPALANFDGLWNHQRVPELARWIDANYPTKTQIGRFILATPGR